MKNILVVESSPLGQKSVSRRLTGELVAGLVERHPGSRVCVCDLAEKPLPHLSAEALAAFATAPKSATMRRPPRRGPPSGPSTSSWPPTSWSSEPRCGTSAPRRA